MKTTITITGQISGNHALANSIATLDSETKRIMFNGYQITFSTKAAAKKALWQAYKYLRLQEPEFAKFGISYSKYGTLQYDASTAKIND